MSTLNKTFPILLMLIFQLFSCKSLNEERTKPNIILILADDLGYGELGCYGQQIIQTPNIDKLSQEGMKFTQFYTGSPVCAPARCVLLTGKHTGHAYIRGNDEWRERGEVWDYAKAVEDPNLEGQRPIPAGTVTIEKILQEEGYQTACIGKWGLGGPLTKGIPNLQGFDFFYGYNCQRQAHTYYPLHLWKNQEKVWLENELVIPGTKLDEDADTLDSESYKKFTQTYYAPDLMLEEALNFIEQNKEQPFFLYYATPIPHAPLQAPEDLVAKYQQILGDEEPYTGDAGYFPNRTPHATYAAMIEYLDQQAGKIVMKLKELYIDKNTIIFFTSDNGPTFNGGTDSPFFNSAGPFKSERGWGKASLHEGGIRVPLIASWPGVINPGTNSDFLGVFYDVLPTLCDVAESTIPENSDGISFLPTLLGDKQIEVHEFLYWEFPAYGGQQAVRIGKWKGLRENILDGNMDIQLFNLEMDIQELQDVSNENPDIVMRIGEIMKTEHTPSEIERFRMERLGDNPDNIQ